LDTQPLMAEIISRSDIRRSLFGVRTQSHDIDWPLFTETSC